MRRKTQEDYDSRNVRYIRLRDRFAYRRLAMGATLLIIWALNVAQSRWSAFARRLNYLAIGDRLAQLIGCPGWGQRSGGQPWTEKYSTAVAST